VALVATSRFVLDLQVGPRTLEMARSLLATVATYCQVGERLLLMVDDHRPYPQAILSLFGVVRHRRRRSRRGRKKHSDLKPPPGLWVGVVSKLRDASGNLLGVRTRRLFGRLKDLRQQIIQLGVGRTIHTAHVERLNGTLRTQQTRLARRTRNVSRRDCCLAWALALWRDWYNWIRPHATLRGRTPAMALGLSEDLWSVSQYVNCPVHVGDLQRQIWAEQRQDLLTNGLNRQKQPKPLPTS
jgi:hypothetical protein